ncbi:MAG: MauE/DoxX family redox-associated membrane protein [Thermoanaerobaculia bacterium]
MRAVHDQLNRLGVAGALVLGSVLLFAAYTKAIDPEAFAEQIVAEGISPVSSSFAVALVALALELGLGSALLLGVRRLGILVPTALLVVFFLFLTGRAWWNAAHGLGEATTCGCFGNLVDRTPAEAFWQDLLMMVPALVLCFLGRDRGVRPPWRRLVAVAAITVGGVAFAAVAPGLPLDDLATRLKPGVPVTGICTGADEERLCLDAVADELESGRHLVIIAELDDERLLAAMPRLNDLALAAEGPLPWILTASPAELVGTFRWTQAPIFEAREAPATLLRPLYRRTPRSFEVVDGTVTATWPGLPPEVVGPAAG